MAMAPPSTSAPIPPALVWPIFLSLSLLAFCIHRLCRDPFRALPGPFTARLLPVRNLFHVWSGDLHHDLFDCHRRYGSVVRYAPNKVVFNTVTAIQHIYPAHTTVTKSAAYDTKPFQRDQASLFNCIDPSWASFKKKLIGPANGAAGRAIHQKCVLERTRVLVELLSSGETFDVSLTLFHFALDVVSESILGHSFDLMRQERYRWLPQSILNGNVHMYLQMSWPALFAFLDRFIDTSRITYPKYHQDSRMFLQAAREVKRLGSRHDSIYSLMQNASVGGASDSELESEVFTFLRAGGDTVAVVLSAFFFYVSTTPGCHRRLFAEVRSAFRDPGDICEGPALSSCEYLRACVDESLRMAPPGPGVFWRQSLNDTVIDGIHIPAGTDIGIGIHALHYNEDAFTDPFTFRPDRFLRPGTRDGLVPFLRGFRSCPAQKLAYSMMLLPTAYIIWTLGFDRIGELGGGIKGIRHGPRAEQIYQQIDMFSSKVSGPLLRFWPACGGSAVESALPEAVPSREDD